jgi:hypothetical protein
MIASDRIELQVMIASGVESWRFTGGSREESGVLITGDVYEKPQIQVGAVSSNIFWRATAGFVHSWGRFSANFFLPGENRYHP